MTAPEFAETYKGWRVKYFGGAGRVIGHNSAGQSVLIEPDIEYAAWPIEQAIPKSTILFDDAERGFWVSVKHLELISPPKDNKPLPLPG